MFASIECRNIDIFRFEETVVGVRKANPVVVLHSIADDLDPKRGV